MLTLSTFEKFLDIVFKQLVYCHLLCCKNIIHSFIHYRQIRNINSVLPRSLECLNSTCQFIWKITSSLLRYLENQQRPIPRYPEYQVLNQDLWNASTAHFEISRRLDLLPTEIPRRSIKCPTEISGASAAHLPNYPEYQQHSTKISGMPQQPISKYLEDQQLPTEILTSRNPNIPPTEISGISKAFYHYQDL